MKKSASFWPGLDTVSSATLLLYTFAECVFAYFLITDKYRCVNDDDNLC